MSTPLDENLSKVFRLLRDRAGVEPESFGIQSIVHAVRKRVAASGADSPQDYLHRLSQDSGEFQALLEDLVAPETWFFRDTLAFRALARHLSVWCPPHHEMVRVLSVGCGTGEEVYSLAMALREAGIAPSRFRILGTDVSRRSLELAKEGRFPARSFREPEEAIGAICDRWCERVGESWRVRDELRAGVEFQWGNLAEAEFLAGESPFKVAFCRNVLIYFHADARRMAVRHLDRLLSPDGLLCSAPAEARVFSEAGFGSLGSECPFAFRRQDSPAAVSASERMQAKSQPLAGSDGTLASPPPPRAAIPWASSGPPGRRDAGEHAAVFAANATRVDISGQAILHAAQQAADSGLLQEADMLCGQALANDPAIAEAHYLRGVVRQAQGMFIEAQRSLEKALYLDPRHYQALVHMTLLAQQRGDRLAAANYHRRAEQVTPREAE